MATWRVNNSTLLGGEVCAQWQPNHAYSLGARCVCRIAYGSADARGYVYECTTAGTSHATTEPTWPTTAGNTVVDNEVTWTCRVPNDGEWDNASCILHYLMNHGPGKADGDTYLLDDGHSENISIFQYNLSGSNTVNNPTKILCVDKADDSLSVGAVINSTVDDRLYFKKYLYSYGVKYTSNKHIMVSSDPGAGIELESDGSCVLEIPNNNVLYLELNSGIFTVRNGNIKFAGSAASIVLVNGKPIFRWIGGSVTAPSGVSALFDRIYSDNGIEKAIVRDVDLSEVGDGANARYLFKPKTPICFDLLFERCKLPDDAGFAFISGAATLPSGKARFHHCSSASRYYDFYEYSYEGTVEDETTIVRTGGASDGTTGQAWKMISSANAIENYRALESPPITIWNSDITEKTFTIECVLDSATNLQDDEVWMELEYPADSSSGLGAITRDKCAILGTPADQTASTETWSGTDGFSNENKFKLSVTVTPGKAGPVTARVYLAKPSTTIYVDPKITIS